MKPTHLPTLAQAFDGEAHDYDTRFSARPAARLMRRTTHEIYARHLAAGQTVLDLNCGTGEDLAYFQRLGLAATGIDLSPQMLAHARQLAPHARLVRMDFNEIFSLDDSFHAICSNFGGFNTQPEFAALARACRQRLRPQGLLFVNIMTRWPLIEILEGILTLSHFLRRHRHGGMQRLKVGDQWVPTWYFDPHHFYRRFFSQEFELVSITGLGIWVPPPYLRFKRAAPLSLLARLERPIRSIRPFNKLGDHAMLVMRARRVE